jgi:hypothetical protein
MKKEESVLGNYITRGVISNTGKPLFLVSDSGPSWSICYDIWVENLQVDWSTMGSFSIQMSKK